ncbi:F-box DNA helicase 1-like isoform X2 [Alosa sapidissima]|uniref:F-box DNA helicase 1-like isoform X2 n=1 Tax=Alosa sapidissima TaxID=34773 RepID=UPI001C098257|nr:F-box DNA helicase 1-like isoform X2 [Alosa sapidissima]
MREMPANRLKSPGQSPRTPYSPQSRRGRRVQPAGTSQQRTLDSYFGRNTGNVPQQREPEVVQAPPPPPDTRIDALPETVLRAILAMLPAPDLLLRANQVCRQWRNIISSEGFCRWKKCYIRYHQQEEVGKQEVISILQENRMTPDDNNNLCLLHMAKYMSQTFHCMTVGSEGDRENRILECIRSHRLYEQARACMPESMKQTEDPWSSLALMLVLADGVEEVWQLVVSLRSPLTPEQLSEFLWCSATLLRAMADKRVKISNRLHYNIYYVLHIMENILPSNRSEADQGSENQMTPEQQQILNHNTEEDHVVKIMAFAGTGKTTTLVRYAKQRPSLRFLYVVFNKPAQMQAKRIFPDNVSCKTIHSLAHAAVGQRYREKLGLSSLNIFSVFRVLPDGERSIVWAKVVTKTINNFWASTDPHIDTQHVPECTSDDKPHKEREILENACCIWDRMKEVENTPEAAYHMYHDGYLKLWQLEGSQIKHDEHYDVIFIDDAQDCTPVMLHILLSQPCAKILVGDPHQHIYSFRGAINNLNTIQHTHIYYLTQSFRFGPEIAYVGVTILEVGKDVKKTMVGGNQRDSVRGQDVEMRQRYQTGVGGADGRLAILSRTNASIFHEAVRLTGLNPTSRIYIIGGIKAFGLSTIRDIWALKQREHGLNLPIESDFIRLFSEGAMDGLKGYAGLCQYAEKDDKELMWKITVVNKYGKCILELVEQIRSQQCRQQCDADFILSSVHKAKGLEFDTVFITDDFRALQALPAQEQGGNQSIIEEDEWNLIYVAVTRAKRTVFITRTITNILARAGEYFLRSELTTVPAENPVLQCSTPRCSNYVNLNTRLRMHRVPITYADGVEKGGPLCLPCVNRIAGHLAFLMSPGIRQIPFP